MNLDRALMRNVGTCRSDAKRASRAGDPREALSIDAEHRGRTAHSRDEGTVMVLDRCNDKTHITVYCQSGLTSQDTHQRIICCGLLWLKVALMFSLCQTS